MSVELGNINPENLSIPSKSYVDDQMSRGVKSEEQAVELFRKNVGYLMESCRLTRQEAELLESMKPEVE